MKGEKSWRMVLQVIRIRGSFEFSITVAQCLNENGHPQFSPSLSPSIFSGYDFKINLFSSQPTHH